VSVFLCDVCVGESDEWVAKVAVVEEYVIFGYKSVVLALECNCNAEALHCMKISFVLAKLLEK
jgi:hypothetical protein